jgi:hypothetical protein
MGLASPADATTCWGAGAPPDSPPLGGFPPGFLPGFPPGFPPGFRFRAQLIFAAIHSSAVVLVFPAGWVAMVVPVWVVVWAAIFPTLYSSRIITHIKWLTTSPGP